MAAATKAKSTSKTEEQTEFVPPDGGLQVSGQEFLNFSREIWMSTVKLTQNRRVLTIFFNPFNSFNFCNFSREIKVVNNHATQKRCVLTNFYLHFRK